MTSVWALLRQRARRDAVQVGLWSVGAALLAYLAYAGVVNAFGSAEDRASLVAAALANPVILLFRGLPSGTGESAFMVFLILPWLAMLAAFMSTFLAVRHTRGDEESGRAELVAATPAARTAPIVATAVHGLLANLLLAALTALAFLAVGGELGGSLLVGVAAGSAGIAFLGVGLFSAQTMRTSRGANSAAVWVVLVAFLVAGTGNAIGTPSDDLTRMESSWLTWLSPFGWAENTRAFDADAWWPALLCLGLGMLLTAAAVVLTARRDLGAAFISERGGRDTAPALLSTTTGLTWRLSRGAIAGWSIGALLTGILSTSLASVVESIGAENPAIEGVLAQIAGAGDLEQATVSTFFTMVGALAASAAVQTLCRARQEEAHGTAEPLLSAPVGRMRWLADYVAVGAIAIVCVVAASVAGAALGIAAQNGRWELMTTVLVTGGGQVAAAAVFLAVTALLFAVLPRATILLGWSLVLAALVLGLFGPIFGFPEWLTHLSPIAAAPQVEEGDVLVRGLWWLIAIAVAVAAASLALMRRRELTADG